MAKACDEQALVDIVITSRRGSQQVSVTSHGNLLSPVFLEKASLWSGAMTYVLFAKGIYHTDAAEHFRQPVIYLSDTIIASAT